MAGIGVGVRSAATGVSSIRGSCVWVVIVWVVIGGGSGEGDTDGPCTERVVGLGVMLAERDGTRGGDSIDSATYECPDGVGWRSTVGRICWVVETEDGLDEMEGAGVVTGMKENGRGTRRLWGCST